MPKCPPDPVPSSFLTCPSCCVIFETEVKPRESKSTKLRRRALLFHSFGLHFVSKYLPSIHCCGSRLGKLVRCLAIFSRTSWGIPRHSQAIQDVQSFQHILLILLYRLDMQYKPSQVRCQGNIILPSTVTAEVWKYGNKTKSSPVWAVRQSDRF